MISCFFPLALARDELNTEVHHSMTQDEADVILMWPHSKRQTLSSHYVVQQSFFVLFFLSKFVGITLAKLADKYYICFPNYGLEAGKRSKG